MQLLPWYLYGRVEYLDTTIREGRIMDEMVTDSYYKAYCGSMRPLFQWAFTLHVVS